MQHFQIEYMSLKEEIVCFVWKTSIKIITYGAIWSHWANLPRFVGTSMFPWKWDITPAYQFLHLFSLFRFGHFLSIVSLTSMTRWVQICKVGVLYNTNVGVTAVRKPEVVGSNPVMNHNFYVCLDTR